MRTRPDAIAALLRPLMAAVLLAGLAPLGCSSPTSTDAHVEILAEQYRFACRTWMPAPPPATRSLFDLRLWQIDTARAPATQLVAAIQAVGGRVMYRFHGPMVRAELDVAVVPRLVGSRSLSSAVTVAEPNTHEVTLVVMLSHDLTAADLQAVEALGGRITREFHAIEGYVAVIDDARVPEVRALPGVALAGFDGTFCLD